MTGPANPRAFPSGAIDDAYGGMTLRDWFAGQALPVSYPEYGTTAEIARAAYHMADAMLAERNKK